MQDVDAKRSAFRSGLRSHETHAVLTDNRTDSLRRGDDSHVGRLRSNKAHQRRRGSPWIIRTRGAARPAFSLRPAYYLACNMMWSSSTTRHVGWLRWVLTLWPDGLDAWNPFLPNPLASPPHGSPPRFMVICSFSGAPLRRRPLDRFSGHHSMWPAATRLVAARAFCRIDCALRRRDQPATLRSPNPIPPLDRMVTGRLSSVDVENFPGHETRRVQVHDRVHDIRLFSHSAHRM